MFFQYLFTDFQYFLWWVIIATASVCLHELFHALAACWQGDSTARDLGYFTLNPLKHMGTASLVMLMLTGMCWGQCPVDPTRLRHRYSDALVSFAGPFANLLLMLFAGLLMVLLIQVPLGLEATLQRNVISFLELAAVANAAFFILNLIPVPPLDGSEIVASLMPATRPFFKQLGNAGFIVLFLIFSIPAGNHLFWDSAAELAHGSALFFSTWI